MGKPGSHQIDVTVIVDAVGGSLTAEDTGKCFSNEGATALVSYELPTAVVGMHYGAVVQDANGIELQADTSDTIRLRDQVAAAPGAVSSTTVGDFIQVVCWKAGEWVASIINGSWIGQAFPLVHKLDATAAPGVTNDIDEGYVPGSIWVDVTADLAYICLDNTDGVAVWTAITGGGGSAPNEEEFATTGLETALDPVTFGPLTNTPGGGGTAATPSGYNILVFRNGRKLKYAATPTTIDQYFYDSVNNEIDILAAGVAEDYEVVYGE